MALDAASILSLFSALLAVSATLDTLKVGSFWLKIALSILSFLSSSIPLMIKLHVFLKTKQTRRLLILKALQKFILSDYYEEFNFYLWANGWSLYSNIFCENRSYVVGEFNVISKFDNLYDLEIEKENLNSTSPTHENEREIDFGFVSRGDMRMQGIYSFDEADYEAAKNRYITERIYFQDKKGYDEKATLILKDFQHGERYFKAGEYFLRGADKTDVRGEWSDSYSFMYYPKRIEKTDFGDVRIDAEFHPKISKLRFRIRNLNFPQGLLTPWVEGAGPTDFINAIKVVEYMDEKGWIDWEEKKRKKRRDAHIFHAVNLTDAVMRLRNGEYKLYEVRHLTYNQPSYVE